MLGNFELDFDDGEIRDKTSIDVEGDRLTPALVRGLVYPNVRAMGRALPAIRRLIEGGLSAEDVFALVSRPLGVAGPRRPGSCGRTSVADGDTSTAAGTG